MKRIFTGLSLMKALCYFMFLFPSLIWSQIDGDYRTKQAAVTWSNASHWQVRSAGAWATASVPPISSNNVYIQTSHTATIDVAIAACNDLHLNTGGILAATTNVLEVNGKIRAFTGTANLTTADMTTTNSTNPGNGNITCGSGGKVKFVGNSRNITNVGEWSAVGLTTSAVIEFALTSGQIGTILTGFKTNTVIVSSGTIDMGTNRLAADNGSTGGSCTIKSGAILKSNQSTNAVISRTGTGATGLIDLQTGSILELTGAAPFIIATTFNNNGTIKYSGTSAQILLKEGLAGTTIPTTCTNMVIANSTSVTLGGLITVSGDLTFTDGGRLLLAANNLTVNGIVTGSTLAGYIVTDGLGTLTQNVGMTSKIFPIGSSLTSYDQVSITNSSGTNNFSASVKPTFTNLPSTPTQVFSREWNITSASSMANLAFTPNATSTPSPAPTVFTLGHYTSGAWVETYAGVSGGTYSGTFTSFSPFGVGQNGSFSGVVLGVELTNLIAKANKNNNQLSWQTTTEKNNAQFQIERSQNGEIFSKIGEVKGRGNSNVEQNYTFTDASPVKGINYYRLRQVDFDGTETISKTVSATFDGKGQNKFKVYPTLTQDLVNIELNEEGKTEIAVRDLTGRVLLTKNTEGVSNATLNLGTLANGLYIMSVRSNDAFETVKIQKY
jgi:uncharacterized protein affecting Mg2+/Co2+ transport